MTAINLKGKVGEYNAVVLLKSRGYKIIRTNFYSKFGEIDIIAEKNGHIYFCEVKTRWSIKYGLPEESVSKFKLNKIRKTIDFYMFSNRISNTKLHILVISQLLNYKNSMIQKIIEVDRAP